MTLYLYLFGSFGERAAAEGLVKAKNEYGVHLYVYNKERKGSSNIGTEMGMKTESELRMPSIPWDGIFFFLWLILTVS